MRMTFISVALLGLSLIGCATTKPTDPDELAAFERTNDPYEDWNRGVWKFNQAFDSVTFKPLAQTYRATTPEPLRGGVRNFYDTIGEPLNFVHNLLQGEPKRAGRNFLRLIINATVGIGGLFDAASDFGIRSADEDLGQTLAVWGVGSGPFLMLPVLGPSNPRDFVGFVGDAVGDPVGWGTRQAKSNAVPIALTATQLIAIRESVLDTVDSLVAESQDPYAALRSAYQQNRVFEIYNGNPPIDEEDDPFGDDF